MVSKGIEVGDKIPDFTFKTAKLVAEGASPNVVNITTDQSKFHFRDFF